MSRAAHRSSRIEPLERRALLAGVTLVTHGYNSGAGDWVATMGNLIAQQSGPLASQPRYVMTATDTGNGTPITVSSQRLAGAPAPAQWSSSEIVVLLDWSALAGSLFGRARSTQDVGTAVASKLLSAFSVPDLATPLAQLPLHLLGHSRGASLVSEIARGLGQRGAWVDHVTYFDPHPLDGVREPPFAPNYGDAAMRVYDNVLFADNYWRSEGDNSFDVTGEPVTGAYNLRLTESVLTGTGYDGEHSDTHLFYHATIGPAGGPFQNGDGGATIGPTWFDPPHPPRDSTGWRYARRAASGTRPAAGLKFSAAPRDALPLTVSGANVWDNVQINGLLGDFSIVEGQSIIVPTQWADLNDDATITIGLDRDDDPYNGVFARGGMSFASAGLADDATFAQLATTGIAGRFRVYAKITNGTNTRYYYAPGRATITAAGFDNTWVGPVAGAWSTPANWSRGVAPAPADKVAIYDSAVTLASTTRIADLFVNDTAKLDLLTSTLIIDYGPGEAPPVAHLAARLAAGRGDNADWTGDAGILSSVAAASNGVTALALGDPAALYGLSATDTLDFAGHTIDATTMIVKYTYDGDANLDGLIDGADYGLIDNYVQFPGTTGYWNGDFNYDGVIDGADYGVIDNAIQFQGPPL